MIEQGGGDFYERIFTMPKDPPTKPETPKRATPKPSPEFAALRAMRDLRLLDERELNLTETYQQKMQEIAEKRFAVSDPLSDEAKAILGRLMKTEKASAAEVKS